MLNINRGREVPDGVRLVHVVSRTAGQEVLFGDLEKETFQKILFKQLKFSGLGVFAWCFMGNHFHLLLEVPDREEALSRLSDEQVLARLSVFGKETSTKFLLAELETCRKAGNAAGIERLPLVERDHVHVDRDGSRIERLLGNLAANIQRRNIDEHQVVIRATADKLQAASSQNFR